MEMVEFNYFEYKGTKLTLRKDKVIGCGTTCSGMFIITDRHKFRVEETEEQIKKIMGW